MRPAAKRLLFPSDEKEFVVSIHPLSCVSSGAKIGENVEIGPFCVVEKGAVLGDGCRLKSHVTIKSSATIGKNNTFFEGAVIGGVAQHIVMPTDPGKVIMGDNNVVRESVTIHGGMKAEGKTVVGNSCFFMVNAHVAHDCTIGNNVILTNNCMLAGHVSIGERAFVSGAVAIHQFCNVGTLAMVGGQAHITKDVPPFVTVDGLSSLVVGLNSIGLRRAGYTATDLRQLKEAYHLVYNSGLPWNEVLDRLKAEFAEDPGAEFHRFFSKTTRGIVNERRMPRGATLKIRKPEETQEVKKAVG